MTVFVYTFCDKRRDMVMLKTCSYSVHDLGSAWLHNLLSFNYKMESYKFVEGIRQLVLGCATEYNIHYGETPLS